MTFYERRLRYSTASYKTILTLAFKRQKSKTPQILRVSMRQDFYKSKKASHFACNTLFTNSL